MVLKIPFLEIDGLIAPQVAKVMGEAHERYGLKVFRMSPAEYRKVLNDIADEMYPEGK